MKLYTEEQIRELLSNMLLTTEQVESMLKELKPQDIPAIDITTNPEGINVWKELYDRYKLTSLVDELNVIDLQEEQKKHIVDIMEADEKDGLYNRMDIIGQNGNEGTHYDK